LSIEGSFRSRAGIARLKKELRGAKLEKDILKKAVSIFSKSDGKSMGS
jgi:transposase